MAHKITRLSKNVQISFYFFVISLIIYSLFILTPTLPNLRSLEQLWDLGHLGLFFLLSYFSFRTFYYPATALHTKHHYFTLASITIICGFLVGGAIEVIQHYVGRSPSLKDLLFDVIGALLGFAYCTTTRNNIEKFISLAIYCISAICTLPMLTAYADERYAAKQFPVIAQFKSPLELSRLKANTPIKLQKNYLEITFKPEGYANIQWTFFPRDWRGFNSLVIDVKSPEHAPYKLNCRMHDAAHENNWSYHDRFHQEFSIQPGQQYLKIDLASVAQSPKNRTMDMTNIAAFGCFTKAQASTKKLIFNEIRLKK